MDGVDTLGANEMDYDEPATWSQRLRQTRERGKQAVKVRNGLVANVRVEGTGLEGEIFDAGVLDRHLRARMHPRPACLDHLAANVERHDAPLRADGSGKNGREPRPTGHWLPRRRERLSRHS